MLDVVAAHWDGTRWRLWSFVAGVAAIPLAVLLAFIVATISGERTVPLILLILVALILGASVVGSGIIEGLSSQLNRGGLARETTDDVDRALGRGGRERRDEDGEERRERRTIRAGLFVLGPIVGFVYFMTIL